MKENIIAAAVLTLISGCSSEQSRAAHTALHAYESRGARLLTYVPMVSEDCFWGCYTEVCAVLELQKKQIADREIIFVRAGGPDDSSMWVGGKYASLKECQAHFNRG